MPDGSYGPYTKPTPLSKQDIMEVILQYQQAAVNAMQAGKRKQDDPFFSLLIQC